MTTELDSPDHLAEIQRALLAKPALRALYEERYRAFEHRVRSVDPLLGDLLELGSGGGFIQEILPEIVTSDVIPYEGVDRVLDATAMDLPDGSLRGIFLLNVFHHIPNVSLFLTEAARTLSPGGVLYISDQYPGWLARPILKYAHHEPFDDRTLEWRFESRGPLSDANGALPWNVFFRDRAR
ncbi:MAG: class I SAM-dependent methyltransferase, partial [Myxococcota bacterium]